jgi:creatinine amidohydrolase
MAIMILIIIFLSSGTLFSDKKQTPTTREMNLLTWTEFYELVPARVKTVLLPVGSLEPHGVIPNGTDNICPTALARAIAKRLNALIAPTLNYGITPAMQGYPGAVSVTAASYRPFVKDILSGLADNKFENIIVLNGHGGNSAILKEVTTAVANEKRIRILMVNWWSLADADTKAVFKEDGGHAGNNETAYVQAVVPDHIHPERYQKWMAMANARGGSWYAVPVAASIGLYKEGEGYPTFDTKQAKEYYKRVNNRVATLISTVIDRWDKARVFK